MSQSTLSRNPYRNSNLFSGHYLKERIKELDEWEDAEGVEAAFDQLKALWEKEGDLVDGQKEDPLIDAWIDPVLEILGYDAIPEPTLPDGGGYIDRLLYESEEVRRDAAMRKLHDDSEGMFNKGCGLLEAKQWNAGFEKRFSEERQYRDASHQVKFYLERTPETIQWGILTNGKKWRLYGTKDYETQTFYEIDLPELLESGDVDAFKYFYLFFRPEAFKRVTGDTFLDTVWNESETAAQELGEDLQDNVFTALRVLGKGFLETNDLNIDPDDEEALDELKEQSLVLLYRLMFILYAESRNLINPDDSEAQREYEENFSLDQKRVEIRDTIQEGETFESAYSEYATSLWQRLQDLFRLIDQGKDDLGIPAYNGGLFDSEEHEFLTDNGVADEYLAEVIYRISTTKTDDGEYVLADYADLDTRHLGSIYEGLLEHEFRIAPEQYAAVSEDGGQVWEPATEVSVADAVETVPEGGLYVVNDEGERKATGSYYTPDYVVTYIVEETIDPLVAEIDENLRGDGLEPSDREYFMRFWQQVQKLKILDPAMGSGHFLTKATGYLTERVMKVVREQELQSYDEQEIRREIAKECIYGVDLNDMAVELAKLSMWLETLATDQPLAFLDHHLKIGNSLVGSDISEILSIDDEDGPSGQTTLSDWMAQTRREALEHVMELMQDLLAIENDSLDDIKAMEQTYEEIRDDPLFTHLLEMASVHTAGQFGLDVPENADEQMARALRDESWEDVADTDWFKSAQAMAGTEQFFHWEMEFPEVFFDESGDVSKDAGFDAVVGNPPYVRIQRIHSELTDYLFSKYETCASRTDLSLPFLEAAIEFLNSSGTGAYISTSQWTSTDYGRAARKYFSNGKLRKILDFHTLPVFEGVSTYPAVYVMSKEDRESLEYTEVTDEGDLNLNTIQNLSPRTISYSALGEDSWVFDELDLRTTLTQRSPTTPLAELGHFHIGAITGLDDVFVVDEETIQDKNLEKELIFPYAHRNNEIERYATVNPGHFVIYPYKSSHGDSELLTQTELEENYPNIYKHLSDHLDDLRERKDSRRFYAKDEDWYRFLRPGRFDYINAEKLLFRGLAKRSYVGWLEEETVFSGNNCPGFISDNDKYSDKYLVALLNSTLLSEYLVQLSPAKMQDYSRFNANDLNETPIRTVDFGIEESADELAASIYERYKAEILEPEEPNNTPELSEELNNEASAVAYEFITSISEDMTGLVDELLNLNLSILDHLGNYSEGKTLTEIGFSQPPKNSADSILHETTETHEKLQVERTRVERETPNTVTIHLTARYKPDDEEGHDLDQYGYTETEFLPALRITDLTETEADLIEAFVPVAVDEAGGFAGFRDNATKNNSLIDRLKALTLPKVDDVEDGLASYIETKERAEELEAKIEKTDELIDQIVYELYGLTDEEIEIVENAVND